MRLPTRVEAEVRAIPSRPAAIGEANHWNRGEACPDDILASLDHLTQCTERTLRMLQSQEGGTGLPISTTDRPRKRKRGTGSVDREQGAESNGHDESLKHISALLAATQALANFFGVQHGGTKWPAPGGNMENPLCLAGCRHASDRPIYFNAPDGMPAPDSWQYCNVNAPADSTVAFSEGAYPQSSQEGGGVYGGQGAPPVYFPNDFQHALL